MSEATAADSCSIAELAASAAASSTVLRRMGSAGGSTARAYSGAEIGRHRHERLRAGERSPTLTHSSSAWAPSPPGPNSTVGMPAAEMNAESAQ